MCPGLALNILKKSILPNGRRRSRWDLSLHIYYYEAARHIHPSLKFGQGALQTYSRISLEHTQSDCALSIPVHLGRVDEGTICKSLLEDVMIELSLESLQKGIKTHSRRDSLSATTGQ